MMLSDFKVSQSVMRTTMQCHPSLYHVMYLGKLLFAVQQQCFHLFDMVFIYLFFFFCLSFLSDAADNEHS